MTNERVQAELAARRTKGAVLDRLGGLRGIASMLTGGGVPRPIRTIVEETFGPSDPFERYRVLQEKRVDLGTQLQNLSRDDWSRSVRTLLPDVASSAESALKALEMRPYQEGFARKPFRSRASAQSVADVRGRWLLNTTVLIGEYDADITWIAERAAHLAGWSGGADLGWLLAGALDLGGKTGDGVFAILEASARGEHETAQMGRHVTQALMSSSRADAWELAERLLLSAQRQEGLRQVILESVDEAHPEAFRRMLRLIREENLSRFSSVVRAADTWFGFLWDGSSAVQIDSLIDRVLLFLDDPAARKAAYHEKDAETVYLALWATAFVEIDLATGPASSLLSSPSAEIRFVATHFLVQALWSSALRPLVKMLADPDLRIATRALDSFSADVTGLVDGKQLFSSLEQLIARVPKRSKVLEPIVWPWMSRKLEKPTIASAMAANASAVPGERLLPYIPDLKPAERAAFVRTAAGLAPRWGGAPATKRRITPAERTVMLELLGDSSADVREAVFEAMRGLPLLDDEVARLIDLLDRKPGDLRSASLKRLSALRDDRLLAAADTLLADPDEQRRLAGLELLRNAAESKRALTQVRSRLDRYAEQHPSLTDVERVHVAAGDEDQSPPATTSNGLGLLDQASLRSWPVPEARSVEITTRGARASLNALAELILAHASDEVATASGETKVLIEAAPWGFGPQRRDDAAGEQPAIPLAAVWRGWVEARPAALRDDDALELLRALSADHSEAPWKTPSVQKVLGLGQYSRGSRFMHGVLEWCAVWDPPADAISFLLDGLEASIAALSAADYRELTKQRRDRFPFTGIYDFQNGDPPFRRRLETAQQWLRRVRWWRDLFPNAMQPSQAGRLYGLLRAFEARSNGYAMLRVSVGDFVSAYRAHEVGELELVDLLVGKWAYSGGATLLREVSVRKPPRALSDHPELLAAVDQCRRRIVEIESQRGDRETAASGLAMELRLTGGLDTVSRALPALGKTHFARSFSWSESGASRQQTLSHLVIRSLPRDEDTRDAFAAWAREAKIKEARLVELAVYAPQWAAHVNHVLGWPGLEDAVWWIQAHTKDDRSWQLREMKEIWAAEVSERTPLSPADLTEGAVDVAWFRTAFAALGAERWAVLDKAAKYAASSGGHTRAQLFARAMAGLVTRDEIMKRIDASRHQDSVRALGLLPLADGGARATDLLERYTRLQEFRREARKFGSQRQASEGRAMAIGMANLARTAGYRDPQRLQWAMEQAAVADLARGPIVLTRGEVTVSLSIDADGVPALTTTKGGKTLKALPASLKKDGEVEELKDRLKELKRQRSRVRDALEDAMCRGDRFGSAELRALLEHPILAPALARIVFVGDGLAGYLAEGGRVLRDHGQTDHAIGHGEELRIAHPHDLLTRGDWSAWQRDCFRTERVQPFKQVFRELYPLTESERGTSRSLRYGGHQVNPRQALALLGGRGWVARPEEGVSRTFHEDGLTVRLGFEESFFTPAEVEGLTLDEVIFTKKGEWEPLPLAGIPPRIFSEAMRDLDLVVSVAHRGGVDPEATASTVEMRAALVMETCELLGLANVELKGNHVLIRGELGSYTVHLGSAGVTLMPGTALPIVAVHAQHRGRLFLPFADDDPRTAEVLSKVLLLARDRKIRDPNILEWIRGGAGG